MCLNIRPDPGILLDKRRRSMKGKQTKAKQSLYKHGQVLGVPGCRGFQISRQSAHDSGKIVSPMYRPPLPHPGSIPATHFCRVYLRAIGWPEELMSMKNSNDTIWSRTRDLPACSAVSQPTAPPRVPGT